MEPGNEVEDEDEDDDAEEKEEVEDDEDVQVLPPSSSQPKRKRDEDGEEDDDLGEDDEEEDDVVDLSKSSKKHRQHSSAEISHVNVMLKCPSNMEQVNLTLDIDWLVGNANVRWATCLVQKTVSCLSPLIQPLLFVFQMAVMSGSEGTIRR